MLDNIKFAQYVNEERKKLIKSTRERGIYVSDNAKLAEVVLKNSEITPYEVVSTDKICIDYLDGDGTLLKREYLNEGDTTTPPSDPNLDSEYLIFDGWSDTEYTNITESKTIYAKYTTKNNVTCIFIHIPSANKAISLSFSGTITSVDWGDGTTDTSLSHTYTTIGDYVIKVVGGTSINSYILGSENNNSYVLKCYISNSITRLDSAFKSCHSLTSVVLPSSITVLGQYAFMWCSSLANINLPNSITTIGYDAFYGCPSLTNISLSNNITLISSGAFQSCSSLISINWPSSVTQVSSGVFDECSSLINIKLPNSVTSIQDYAFRKCVSLTNIKLPNGITSIGYEAFASCYSLTNINLPIGITSISNSTFKECKSLTNIKLPDNLVSIGVNAFAYCYSLTSIDLPVSITNIDDSAFEYCYSLKSIYLPSSITTLNSYSFGYCYGVKKVIINAETVINSKWNPFSVDSYGTKFYVSDNLVEDYKTDTTWVNFADRIYPLSSLRE